MVPQPVAYNARCHALLMTEVPGQSFTDLMHACRPDAFAEAGRILAQLHSSYISPETRWTPDRELAILQRHMQGVKRVLPELAPQLDHLIANLEHRSQELCFPLDAPIHGNLFGDQILYGREGIGVVDWDALALGDPLYDVGRLLAHLLYVAGRQTLNATAPSAATRCSDSLLSAYESESGQPVDWPRLTWHVATQLLLRGKISSLRQLPERWQRHLVFAVTEAARVFDGQSPFLRLPVSLEHA